MRSTKKTYTHKEVVSLLSRQRKICATIPLLQKSKMRLDWREWNKFLTNMSKAIKSVKVKP